MEEKDLHIKFKRVEYILTKHRLAKELLSVV